MDYDVIVAGAGYGGVTCAALLAIEGKRVLLVDKNPSAGGKVMTVRRGGYGYELWPIAGGPSEDSLFHKLAEVLGEDLDDLIIQPDIAGEYRYIRADGSVAIAEFSARPSLHPEVAAGLPEAFGATDEDMGPLMDFVNYVLTVDVDAHKELETEDLLSGTRRFGMAPYLEAYLFVSLGLAFAAPIDRIPMSEAILTFREMALAGGGRYGRGGYGRLAELAAAKVTACGGTVLMNTRVEQVLVEDGRAVGIRTTAGDTYRARCVISNAGIQPTVLKLTDAGAFPPAYVETVRELEPSLSFVGNRYWLDEPVLTQPMLMQFSDESWWDEERYRRAEAGEWPAHPFLFFAVPSLFDPDLAPEGGQMFMAGTLCSPDPKSPMNQAAVEAVERELFATFPEIEGHAVRKQAYTALHAANASRDQVVPGQGGECIGIAQVIGQCGSTKPDPRTPLPGLYLVGCDAGGVGCGTHQAVDSGFKVAGIVAADLG
ncbi:MAG: NAD(P)/FAD-dependent oxidoreductase [Acidimicrobiia bacterium]|nr:NAD(P)/FAD-dependent oxidoreductase [Acidimicrobiia bacterium]